MYQKKVKKIRDLGEKKKKKIKLILRNIYSFNEKQH
nr:MAG TPA: hypothetical protein [Caudoviricetes sp.]